MIFKHIFEALMLKTSYHSNFCPTLHLKKNKVFPKLSLSIKQLVEPALLCRAAIWKHRQKCLYFIGKFAYKWQIIPELMSKEITQITFRNWTCPKRRYPKHQRWRWWEEQSCQWCTVLLKSLLSHMKLLKSTLRVIIRDIKQNRLLDPRSVV